MDPLGLSRRVREAAREIGFTAVGITPVREIPPERFQQWLERGYHGTMAYMERRSEERLDPVRLLPGARSVLSLGLNYYHPRAPEAEGEGKGVISRYALGRDYHKVIRKRLVELMRRIQSWEPAARGRLFVDAGPMMDKVWAARAGLGWLGKNANLISRQGGSWFFLAEILLNLELKADAPVRDHCGSCTRCLDACPTQAIVEPYVVDARRCISYLTIELRDDIPLKFRSRMGNLIFGCDICQDVCPWNHRPVVSPVESFRDPGREHDLIRLAALSEVEFDREFAGSAVRRARWAGFLRNVAVAMGNSGDRRFSGALQRLATCSDARVRRHARWALEQLGAEVPSGDPA